MQERYIIQSVQKSLQILKYFTTWETQYSLSELTKISGMNKSNVLRILTTFEAENLLQFDERSEKYRLGPWFLSIASNFDLSNLKALTKDAFIAASKESRMIVHLTVLAGDELIVLNRIFPDASSALVLASSVGGSVPLHCTGAGKVIAAYSAEATVEKLLSTCDFHSYTERTITDKESFLKEVAQVKKQGFAFNKGEHEEYLYCLTRPIFYADGLLAGAVSLSGLQEAFDGEKGKNADAISRRLTEEISRSLGYGR